MGDTGESTRLARLRSIPLFADLSDDMLTRIMASATEFEAPPGQVLVLPNQPGSGLFVIEEGTVTVETRRNEFDLQAGEFFGELALLSPEGVRSARVRTKTKVRCLALNREDFEDLLESEPKLAIAMLKTVARRLAAATTT